MLCINITIGYPTMMYRLNSISFLFVTWLSKVSSLVPVVLLLFINWSHSYCSAVTGVLFACLKFLVMIPLVLINLTLYAQLLWFGSSCSSTVPWVHGPLSSQWLATGDPVGIRIDSLRASLLFLFLF